MALVAVAFGFKRRAARSVARSARRMRCFGRLVHSGFEIQGRLLLLEQFVVTDLAVILLALQVGGMVEGDIAILSFEHKFEGRLFVLSQNSQCGDRENIQSY